MITKQASNVLIRQNFPLSTACFVFVIMILKTFFNRASCLSYVCVKTTEAFSANHVSFASDNINSVRFVQGQGHLRRTLSDCFTVIWLSIVHLFD